MVVGLNEIAISYDDRVVVQQGDVFSIGMPLGIIKWSPTNCTDRSVFRTTGLTDMETGTYYTIPHYTATYCRSYSAQAEILPGRKLLYL